MSCAACGAENYAGNRFCGGSGARAQVDECYTRSGMTAQAARVAAAR